MRYLTTVLLFLLLFIFLPPEGVISHLRAEWQSTNKKFVGPQLCQNHLYSQPYFTVGANAQAGTIAVLQVSSFWKPETLVEINVNEASDHRGSSGLLIFSDGKEIARCPKIDPLKNKDGALVVSEQSKLSGCYFENGGNLDSVMTAWTRAVLVSMSH